MHAQSAMDFIVVVAIVLGLVLSFMVPSLRESELTLALSTVRLTVLDYVSKNSSLSFTSIDYSIQGNNVTLSPRIYYFSNRLSKSSELETIALNKLYSVFSPGRVVSTEECISAVYYNYCIDFSR